MKFLKQILFNHLVKVNLSSHSSQYFIISVFSWIFFSIYFLQLFFFLEFFSWNWYFSNLNLNLIYIYVRIIEIIFILIFFIILLHLFYSCNNILQDYLKKKFPKLSYFVSIILIFFLNSLAFFFFNYINIKTPVFLFILFYFVFLFCFTFIFLKKKSDLIIKKFINNLFYSFILILLIFLYFDFCQFFCVFSKILKLFLKFFCIFYNLIQFFISNIIMQNLLILHNNIALLFNMADSFFWFLCLNNFSLYLNHFIEDSLFHFQCFLYWNQFKGYSRFYWFLIKQFLILCFSCYWIGNLILDFLINLIGSFSFFFYFKFFFFKFFYFDIFLLIVFYQSVYNFGLLLFFYIMLIFFYYLYNKKILA